MSASDVLKGLPLIEVHAHLNGSIPPSAIAELVSRKTQIPGNEDLATYRLPAEGAPVDIDAFFPLFGRFIYRLTDDPDSISFATRAVLDYFEAESCVYLELRTTPREIPSNGVTLAGYVDAVLRGFQAYNHSSASEGLPPSMLAKLIFSVDRRHSLEVAQEVVDLAIQHQGVVVGVDVCGDPTKGDASLLIPVFARAKAAGLKVTVHLGEVPSQLESQSTDLLLAPDRLGHATILSAATTEHVLKARLPIEICLSSNLVTKTVLTLEDHHFAWAYANDLPIIICTDDPLIFHNTPSREYELALTLCRPPTLASLVSLIRHSIPALFCSEDEKNWVRERLNHWQEQNEGAGH